MFRVAEFPLTEDVSKVFDSKTCKLRIFVSTVLCHHKSETITCLNINFDVLFNFSIVYGCCIFYFLLFLLFSLTFQRDVAATNHIENYIVC